MTAQAVLDKLLGMFPDFARDWDCPDNYFRERDGSFTCYGVFAEFSHYFRDHHEQLSKEQVVPLATFVIECVDSANTELQEAVTTCFLENVAGEQCSANFQGYLTGEAKRFFVGCNDAI